MSDDGLHRRGAEDAEFPQRELTERIIGAAIEVHRVLGPGLLESVYERALQHELALRGIGFKTQVVVPLLYKGVTLESGLRLDLLVADAVIVEVKAVSGIEEVHRAQLLTYLAACEPRSGSAAELQCPRTGPRLEAGRQHSALLCVLCASAVKAAYR